MAKNMGKKSKPVLEGVESDGVRDWFEEYREPGEGESYDRNGNIRPVPGDVGAAPKVLGDENWD